MGAKRLRGNSISAIRQGIRRLATVFHRPRHHLWTSSRVSSLSRVNTYRFLTSQVSPSASSPSNTSISIQDEFLRIFVLASLLQTENQRSRPVRPPSLGAILLSEQGPSRPLCLEGPLPIQLYPKLLSILVNLTKTEYLLRTPTLSQKPRAISFLIQLDFQERTYRRVGPQDLPLQSRYNNLIPPVHRRSMKT